MEGLIFGILRYFKALFPEVLIDIRLLLFVKSLKKEKKRQTKLWKSLFELVS